MTVALVTPVAKQPRKRRTQAEIRGPRATAKVRRAAKWQTWVALGGVAVIGTLLVLSLSHLADGIRLVTGCAQWEALATAVGVDAGLIVAEAALLVGSASQLSKIGRYAMVMIVLTLVVSAALNALAYGHDAEGWKLIAAIGFGIFVPTTIFVLTKITAGLAAK